MDWFHVALSAALLVQMIFLARIVIWVGCRLDEMVSIHRRTAGLTESDQASRGREGMNK